MPRPLRPADYDAVNRLHRSVGWPERSAAGWRWLYEDPARRAIDAPAAWVVDGPDGRPAAHMGNLVQRFFLGERELYAATGFSVIVDHAARGASTPMLRAFLAQPGVFAAYVFNANSLAAPLYGRRGLNPWPETHALKLAWRIAPLPLAEGRLLRRTYALAPRTVVRLGERLMNPRLLRAQHLDLPPGVSILTDLGDASPYARFWSALKRENRLLADRSPAALRRRLADPDLTIPPLLLAHGRDGAVSGYAMAMMAKANIIDPPVLEIIDLEALAGETAAIPALMDALFDAARRLGAAKLRLQFVSPRLLERLGPWAHTAHDEGGWGHSHIWFAPDAPDPCLWSPTPYDGDYAACLRPVPVAPRAACATADDDVSASSRTSTRRGSRSAGLPWGSGRPAPDSPPARGAAG